LPGAGRGAALSEVHAESASEIGEVDVTVQITFAVKP
jgi:hypothetical protein